MVFALLDWKNAVKQRIWKNCKMDRREMSIFVRCTRTIILPVTQWIIGWKRKNCAQRTIKWGIIGYYVHLAKSNYICYNVCWWGTPTRIMIT